MSYDRIAIDKFGRQYFEGGLPEGGGYGSYEVVDLERRIAVLMELLNPRSVLEVGCAYAPMVKILNERGIFAVGMDISRWCAEQSAAPDNHVVGSATDLPFKDKSFDAVMCIGTLEHVPEDLIPKTMSEFDRVAKRGGLLQISFTPGTHSDKTHRTHHEFGWWVKQVPRKFYLFKLDGRPFTEVGCVLGERDA